MDDFSTIDQQPTWGRGAKGGPKRSLAFVVAWYADAPERVGQVAFMPSDGAYLLGRGGPRPDDAGERLVFERQRPGRRTICEPLGCRGISRKQLLLKRRGQELSVENVGRTEARVNGRRIERATLRVGDTLHVDRQIVLRLSDRPTAIAGASLPESLAPPFGQPDDFGLVGESEAAWALRDELSFVAARQAHVLILGESGTGKELAARAVHGLSARRRGPFVARNAATLPEGLIDAELFGNAANYPNPGMPERPGIIGEANGGTLFLDEIGELPEALQAHLLRVLDSGGEYQRLGESRTRRSDFRLVAATNRDPEALKHDFVPRLPLQVSVPTLGERLDDVPLLARHLVRATASEDAGIGERFLEGWDGRAGEPRLAPELMEALVRHRYSHHVRELGALLWRAMRGPEAVDCLALTARVKEALVEQEPDVIDPESLTREQVLAALERCEWKQTQAYAELGLSSRHVLYRLMKKLDIAPPDQT